MTLKIRTTVPNAFEHNCDKPTRFDRRLFVPDLYIGKKLDGTVINHGTFRIRLFHDTEEGLISLAEEDVSSESENAQTVESGCNKEIVLIEYQALWLARQFHELALFLKEKEREGIKRGIV